MIKIMNIWFSLSDDKTHPQRGCLKIKIGCINMNLNIFAKDADFPPILFSSSVQTCDMGNRCSET